MPSHLTHLCILSSPHSSLPPSLPLSLPPSLLLSVVQVGVEQEKVGKEKEIADEEERKVAKINAEVSKKQRDCETDLAKAEPALQVC